MWRWVDGANNKFDRGVKADASGWPCLIKRFPKWIPTRDMYHSCFWNVARSVPIPLDTPKVISYYVQLQVVSESLGALHPDQNGFLQLRAEAHCQPVCPCARPVIGRPGVCDEGSASPEDVSCPSCKTQREDGDVTLSYTDVSKPRKRCFVGWLRYRSCPVPHF